VTALAFLLLAVATQAAPAPAPAASVTPTAGSSPVSLSVTPSKTDVTVGETFTIDLKAAGAAGTTYTFPDGAETDSFVLRTPSPDPRAGAAPPAEPGTHRYQGAVFAVGDAAIPPIPVRYTLPNGTQGEASSAPVPLKIVSLLPKDAQEQKLADIRPPVPVGVAPVVWATPVFLFGIATAIGLALALALLSLRRRRREEAVRRLSAPEAPPDTEALQALAALARSGLLARHEYRPFYIRLTEVAKRYLERRLEAPVLEMTTAETVAFLRAHRHGGDLLPVVRDLAEAADRIKFARGQGLAEEAERHLAAVRALVPALEAKLRPAPAAGAEGKAA
jgi:hypothetical protein